MEEGETKGLTRSLNGWQIFFIALSAVIGTGIFGYDGLALSLAGPSGLIIATVVIGIAAVAVMDGLSELIQVFPCKNALVEYVHAFVDPDLAICVGVVYWFAWAIYFSLQLGAAADICSAWSLHDSELDLLLRIFIFFLGCPIALYFVNIQRIGLFGWLETGAGFVKLLLVVALGLALYYLAGVNEGIRSAAQQTGASDISSVGTFLTDGFASSLDSPNRVANFFAVIPIVAFSWTGVEIVAVTAYEAVSLSDLRLPSQRIPYVVFLVYFICAIGSSMAVPYNNPALATVFRGEASNITPMPETPTEARSPVGSSTSLIVIAANQVGKYKMAQAFNGILIYSALSAANTSLFVASRTLYGLAANHGRENWFIKKLKLAEVTVQGTPKNAVLASLVFCWVPFLSLIDQPNSHDDFTLGIRQVDLASQQFLNTVSSLGVLFVWGTICLAFVRYYHWIKPHTGPKGFLQNEFPEVNRTGANSITLTLLKQFQPYIAYAGVLLCSGVVMVFPILLLVGSVPASSSATAYEVLQVYITPIFIFVLWLSLKAWQYWEYGRIKWCVTIGDESDLRTAIASLRHMSEQQSEMNTVDG